MEATIKTQKSTDDLWQQYENCLKSHDWTYINASTETMCSAGETEAQVILELHNELSNIDKSRADNLFDAYSFFWRINTFINYIQ